MKNFRYSTLAISTVLVVAISSQSFQCTPRRNVLEFHLDSSNVGEDVIRVLSSDEYEGRATGSESEKNAAAYIIQTMRNIGLTPMGTSGGWTQTFTFVPHPPIKVHQVGDSTQLGMGLVKEISGNNVIGYMDNGASSTVVIGAHYDHLGWGDENSLSNDGKPAIHNGADDNASGVGAMLALAAKLKTSNLKNNNYLFIAFSGEEKGLWGSNFFCKNPTISNMNYMINLDMVGRLNAERALAISGVGTAPSWKVALDNANTFSFKNVYSESGVGPSDHTSFYNIGIPAIHLFTGQHADYHKPTDDADKINYAGVTDITNYLFNIVSQLDDKGKLTFQRTKDESQEAAASFKVTLGVIPDYLFGGEGMRIDGTREGKPAAKAGLKQGDIVIQLGDHKVTDMMSYMEALGKFEKGQTTVVRFIRDEKEQTANVTWE